MVKRKSKNVASEIDKLNENETPAVRDSHLLSNRNPKSKDTNDDLIVSLPDAYENKRERQVLEWEKIGRQNLHQNQQRAV